MTSWTSPGIIAEKILRRWNDGSLLTTPLRGESPFPMRIPLKHPDSESLLHRFSEALEWQKEIEGGSRAVRGFGYEIEWKETNHRQLGRNRIAVSAIVPSEEDALKLIGKWEESQLFRRLAEEALARFPGLREWILRNPLKLVELAEDWGNLLAALEWFRKNPRSELYLRQVDIPGVGTKFIETRKGLLRELTDALLPGKSMEAEAPTPQDFEARFGLRAKPFLVRLRILDESQTIQGLSDISGPMDQISKFDLPVEHVFITENEINGLAFPPLSRSIVIFGLGYGVESLAHIPWLAGKTVHYWGDIDTHGFVMLDRLRRSFPAVRSLLMDRDTLLVHRDQWVEEPMPAKGRLERLTESEQELFQDLVSDRFGFRVRLEQERISFGCVRLALVQSVNG